MNIIDTVTGGATEKVVKPLVTLILVGVVVWLIYKAIQNFKTRNVGFSGGYDSTQLDHAVNYDNLADAVHAVFDGFFGGLSGSEDEALAQKLMALNNDELKYVNDRYAKLYGQGTRSMYKSV